MRHLPASLKWLLPLLLGALFPIAWWIYSANRQAEMVGGVKAMTLEAIAHRDSIPVEDYKDSFRLLSKTSREHDLNAADWRRLLELFNHKDAEVRRTILGAMMRLPKSSHRQEVLSLVRPLLQSDNSGEVTAAMMLLWKFHEPDWEQQVISRRNSTDPTIKYAVQLLWNRRGQIGPR